MENEAAEQLINPATWQIVTAVIVFLITYAIIITEKMNRAVIALFGAVIMLVLGIVDWRIR